MGGAGRRRGCTGALDAGVYSQSPVPERLQLGLGHCPGLPSPPPRLPSPPAKGRRGWVEGGSPSLLVWWGYPQYERCRVMVPMVEAAMNAMRAGG